MKLSMPVHALKRRAKKLARDEDIALHTALDTIAREEGWKTWSLLSARIGASGPEQKLLQALGDGDLLLIGARPGQGKTRLGLQLLLEASRNGRRSVFFTLELRPQKPVNALHLCKALRLAPERMLKWLRRMKSAPITL